MNTVIKFECPGCGQPMEGESEAEFQQCKCPTCGNEFFPKSIKILPTENPGKNPMPKSTLESPKNPASAGSAQVQAWKLNHQRDAIRRTANGFTYVAVLFAILGLVAFLIALLGMGDVQAGIGPWFACAGFWGSALWIYLIAQIIHIRANTES